MFSTRFAAPVLALLTLAAVPTIIHSYVGSAVTDGRSAAELPTQLASQVGEKTKRRANWGEDRLSASDWIERRYAGPPVVKLFVGRSFDAKKLYHHPELAVDYGHNYSPVTTIRLPQRSDVPVYVLRGQGPSAQHGALYALHYDSGYVEDPIRFQLRTSFRSLFSRRQPMTLFFVSTDLPAGGSLETSSAASILVAALAAFEGQAPKQ
jgi:hypothetical protein